MAEYNTIRVGELPPAPWGMTNLLPKEVAGNLTRGTVQQLADLISDYIGTASSLAFNPTTILDGGTLPDTDSPEWVLVGKGTFYNVNGGANITTTEELNALTSNGTVWALSVEIPINVELAGIVQSVRSGYTTTAPSEDAVFNAIAQSIPEGTEMLVNKQNSLVPDPSGVKYITANAAINGLDEKQNTLRLYTVGGNQTVSNDWNRNTIVFTTSGTITVPDFLSVSFYFNGITLPGVNLTWVLTGDTTWVSGDPETTTENKRFILAKKGAEESIIFIADEDITVLTSTDELAEGITNLYFTTARVLSTILTGLSMLTGTAIEATDTVLVALGKLQKQINDINATIPIYKNVIHFGNSICKHPIIAGIWWGEWGMAATIRDNDYVHKFLSFLKIYSPSATSDAFNIANWETNYATFDKSTLDPYLIGKDLVVLRLGENVTYYSDFQNQYKILIQYIQSKVPNATIILGGQFWTNATKETAMQNAANELGLPFVSVKHLDSATYKQTVGGVVQGDDGLPHTITDSGVANHPNDLGMLKIAEALFSEITYKHETGVITPQREIIGNITLDNTFNGCVVKVKATSTITVSKDLMPNFNCVFDVFPTFTATFVAGSGATISSNGLKLLADKMATLYKDGAAFNYRLKGETSV